jgi:hypothetical protein
VLAAGEDHVAADAVADCVVAETCVSLIPGIAELLADKGYDTDRRQRIEAVR